MRSPCCYAKITSVVVTKKIEFKTQKDILHRHPIGPKSKKNLFLGYKKTGICFHQKERNRHAAYSWWSSFMMIPYNLACSFCRAVDWTQLPFLLVKKQGESYLWPSKRAVLGLMGPVRTKAMGDRWCSKGEGMGWDGMNKLSRSNLNLAMPF